MIRAGVNKTNAGRAPPTLDAPPLTWESRAQSVNIAAR
jgi:hypothetical protein